MIFIYSGEVPELDALLRSALGDSHTVTTIPASPDDMASAREASEYFLQAGIRTRVLSRKPYLDPARLRKAIMVSDAVYLTGGNTYEFLAYARQVGLFPMLQAFEDRGGIIIAESAGSIILSPSIMTAALPSSDPDANDIGLKDLSGMGRLLFHISPHHEPMSASYAQDMRELQGLADESRYPVFLLRDGEGLVVDGDDIMLPIGEPRVLQPQPIDNEMSVMPVNKAIVDLVAIPS